jgi:hypothetical protein
VENRGNLPENAAFINLKTPRKLDFPDPLAPIRTFSLRSSRSSFFIDLKPSTEREFREAISLHPLFIIHHKQKYSE